MLRKLKDAINKVLLDESGVYSFFGIILFSIDFFMSVYLIYFVNGTFLRTHFVLQLFVALNFIISIIFLAAFICVIHRILMTKKVFTYDEIKLNPKYIPFLALEDANVLLLLSIEKEDYNFSTLLQNHIKKINENISIN